MARQGIDAAKMKEIVAYSDEHGIAKAAEKYKKSKPSISNYRSLINGGGAKKKAVKAGRPKVTVSNLRVANNARETVASQADMDLLISPSPTSLEAAIEQNQLLKKRLIELLLTR